jgi:hypothetical protein
VRGSVSISLLDRHFLGLGRRARRRVNSSCRHVTDAPRNAAAKQKYAQRKKSRSACAPAILRLNWKKSDDAHRHGREVPEKMHPRTGVRLPLLSCRWHAARQEQRRIPGS